MDSSAFVDMLVKIVGCITPIIVAYFGLRSARSEKETKSMLALKEESEQAKANLQKEREERLISRIDSIQDSVERIESKVDAIESRITEIEKMEEAFDRISSLSLLNYEFSTRMSKTIESIGDALVKSDFNESADVAEELRLHREFENETSHKAMNILY